VGDEAIHLTILFENSHRLRWESPVLGALAGRLDELLKESPRHAPTLVRRALVEVARGNPREATALLRRAAEADPLDAQLALFEGYGWRLCGDYDRAAARFTDALKIQSAPGGRPAGPRAVERARGRMNQRRMHGLEGRAPAPPSAPAPAPAPAPARKTEEAADR
jgi:tetratricopeptide (TPR) repeat protein